MENYITRKFIWGVDPKPIDLTRVIAIYCPYITLSQIYLFIIEYIYVCIVKWINSNEWPIPILEGGGKYLH